MFFLSDTNTTKTATDHLEDRIVNHVPASLPALSKTSPKPVSNATVNLTCMRGISLLQQSPSDSPASISSSLLSPSYDITSYAPHKADSWNAVEVVPAAPSHHPQPSVNMDELHRYVTLSHTSSRMLMFRQFTRPTLDDQTTEDSVNGVKNFVIPENNSHTFTTAPSCTILDTWYQGLEVQT